MFIRSDRSSDSSTADNPTADNSATCYSVAYSHKYLHQHPDPYQKFAIIPNDAAEESQPSNLEVPSSEVVSICRSPLSQLGKISLFILSIPLMIGISRTVPDSVIHFDILSILGGHISISVPAAIILPLIFFVAILWNLFNYKYMLCEDYILEVSGILCLSLRTTRLPYIHIKTVEVNKNLLGRILNFGDCIAACDLTHADSLVEMRGIYNPRSCKDLILARIHRQTHEISSYTAKIAAG